MNSRTVLSVVAAVLFALPAWGAPAAASPDESGARSECYRRCAADMRTCMEEGRYENEACLTLERTCYSICADVYPGG